MSTPSRGRAVCPSRRARVAVLVAATVGVALSAVPPAGAHPFGPPPTALVSASGHEVRMDWVAASDDALVVGMAIGILDDGSLERYLEGPVQTAPPAAAEEELSASPLLREYVLERLTVSQDGVACGGTVAPIDSFLTDGVSVTYACPKPVAVVDLRITMLHDVHDAYRTFALTEGRGTPVQSVFTTESPERRWDFSAWPPERDDGGWSAPLGLLGVVGAIGAGTAGALGAMAWRRRS
ncbi:MAG: hypothetical protein WD080_07495 [Egibacteraceae bacterium]